MDRTIQDIELGTRDNFGGVVSETDLDPRKGVEGDELDDDGKPKRTGTVWTASAHIITAVIGSGVLSLAWCLAQLGWIAGPVALIIFSIITFYTSSLLADCYRSPDPVTGKRNYTYMETVQANLGGARYLFCGFIQYFQIIGVAIGYTITASISMVSIEKSNCHHFKGHEAPCNASNNFYTISFGIIEIILSQIPNFHKLSWLSIVAAIMSFGYSLIGVALSLTKIISGERGKTTLGGVQVGMDLTQSQKMWNMFSALGDIAFAYSFSLILIEIQNTIRAPAENKQMKKASMVGIITTSLFYLSSGCIGYVAFGNNAPGNLLTGFYEPFWLVDIANICIVIHLVGAFQVFAQPLFAVVESWATKRFNKSKFITTDYTIKMVGKGLKLNLFRLVWRSIFVVLVTVMAMAMPFFNDILAFLGAIGYWPLTVYFPIQMYIAQKKIGRFTSHWLGLQLLTFGCFLVALAAACGAIHGVIKSLHVYKPF